MGQVNLPATLAAAAWDKHKPALAKLPKAPATKLGEELKSLSKLHLALDWDGFGSDKLDAAQLKARGEELEIAARGRIKALLEQAQTVEAAAGKFEAEARKDKAFPKEPLAAAALIAKEARGYRAEVETFVDEARKAIAQKAAAARKGARPEPAPGGGAAAAKAAVLVRTRGLESIRKIKKPGPDQKPVRFLVVQGKTQVATYMGPSAGPTQEKLLKSLLPGDAPYKVFKDARGEVVWEKKSVTFVSDVLPAGITKKMQLWLKPLLKLNPKLRVRRTNGDAEETDGDDIPDELLVADAGVGSLDALEAELDGEVADEPDTDAAEAPATAGASASPGGVAGADKAAYQRRLAGLKEALREALLAQHPESTRLRALLGFASEKADAQKDYDGALKALDKLEQLLKPASGSGAAPRAAAAGAAAGAVPATPATAAGRIAPAVVYQQTRLVWGATRSSIQAELKKLEARILADFKGHPVEAELGTAVRKLDGVLAMFDESLIDTLDGALNAADAAEKERWHGEARAVIARYQHYLATDPLVQELDGNPFVPITVQASLSKTLATLASKIV